MNVDENDLNIKHIKLSNGDEIVTLVDNIVGDDIILEFPLLLNSIQTAEGSYTYYFTKYMALTDDLVVHLNGKNIIAYSTVSEEVEDKYIRASLNYREDKEKEQRKVMQQMNSDIQEAVDQMLNYEYNYDDASDDVIH